MNKSLAVIIEDDESLNLLMKRGMSRHGCEILAAESEVEARDVIARAKQYDGPVIFLMDTSLTGTVGTQGIQFTREIQATERDFKYKPLILSTSSYDGDEMRELGTIYTGKGLEDIIEKVKVFEDSFGDDDEESLKG